MQKIEFSIDEFEFIEELIRRYRWDVGNYHTEFADNFIKKIFDCKQKLQPKIRIN